MNPQPTGRRSPVPFLREQDSCGIGFVADIQGHQSHRVLAMAIEALGNLRHRGAVNADGRSGDGTGVLTQIPSRFFGRYLESRGMPPAADGELAVGVFQVPKTTNDVACRRMIAETLTRGGFVLLAWRDVPIRTEVLGEQARDTCPRFLQALIQRPANVSDNAFERRLYLARRRIEHRAAAAGFDGFHTASLSHRTIVYKAMSPPAGLADFYPDLQNPDFETALAIFHLRFSTNTLPSWRLAQPFRMLGHNGEINTIRGNANWMASRERELASALWGDEIDELLPVLDTEASDSAMLDNALELLVMFGRDPLHAMMMLIPEAHRTSHSSELRAFYDYHATLMEPWDGPAAVVFSDGQIAAATLDRNGLRPQRFWVTRDGLVILGSETGIVAVPDEMVVHKGRLGPGQMLAVDTVRQELLTDDEIKRRYAGRRPYGDWLHEHLVEPPTFRGSAPDERDDGSALRLAQQAFGYSRETLERLFDPMIASKQPVGSMGDDTPLAVLSEIPNLLYSYFKQRFAQVTNPPIDSLRERPVFSLETMVGGWGCVIEEQSEAARLIRMRSPILRLEEFVWLLDLQQPWFRTEIFDATFPATGLDALEERLETLCREVEEAVDRGVSLVVLSDRGVDHQRAQIPMLLATAAVHQHLIGSRQRMQVSLICDTGEPREDHHLACLIGYGATLVHPYLAMRTAAQRAREHEIDPEQAIAAYVSTLEEGLLKIMARLGVCSISSYQGAQLFEALGLDAALVDRYFAGTPSRIGGVGPRRLAAAVREWHRAAFGHEVEPDPATSDRGLFRFRKGGEHHSLNPAVFKALHKAVRTSSSEAFATYTALSDEGPRANLRDLLTWRRADRPTPLEEVEPAEDIARRFCTAAMSHGALSREAHEALAVAMNRIGGRSNSGEGGEDPERFTPYTGDRRPDFASPWRPDAGDLGVSAIKQVASGRFGVDAHYLLSARELEIKMAQGSKPGEGGQIPGHKVSAEIASLRRSVPGVSLISPPPHHDIYSIEDLAQLIFDLRRLHPAAKIGVKLVAVAGVGTIAAGVAKAGADYILISGDSGGTGASPLSSIKHAGIPWELGLAEAQESLVTAGLRDRVRLRVDGGLKTGRDLIVAALLGAEEFAFGTTPLIALGCVMARQCHLDTCPVGIATQREELRRRFPGRPENVIAMMLFVAEQMRLSMAEMGFRRLDELVGRRDWLTARDEIDRATPLDLSHLLRNPDPSGERPRRAVVPESSGIELTALEKRLVRDVLEARPEDAGQHNDYPVTNLDRSVGTHLTGELIRRQAPSSDVKLRFRGSAGQSFGAFLIEGVHLRLTGDAQDYVGKGMSGGEILLRPPAASSESLTSQDHVIAGNTLLYGATGGRLFAAGQVGERFCVRNSGAVAVVEGCGDHGCEYMTRGIAVILGPMGLNFGAGMSGGVAYVYDPGDRLAQRINHGAVRIDSLTSEDAGQLRELIGEHQKGTGSRHAASLLSDWDENAPRFRRVVPIDSELPTADSEAATDSEDLPIAASRTSMP